MRCENICSLTVHVQSCEASIGVGLDGRLYCRSGKSVAEGLVGHLGEQLAALDHLEGWPDRLPPVPSATDGDILKLQQSDPQIASRNNLGKKYSTPK